ncbi:hypothetical protein AB0J35_57795 [Nonomuraea angiospora]|uniref:hypothetical protein n=1 Tax=Nonomuraea angiospora TaxID=46172 RepID=UPI003414B213
MPRMIRVRSKISGLETTVNEKAWGAFAAHYDRLDEPSAAADEQPADTAPPAEAAASAKSTRRGTAASKDKE